MLGGGGYTIRNVARCWTYETSIALGVDIANGEYSCESVLSYRPRVATYLENQGEVKVKCF